MKREVEDKPTIGMLLDIDHFYGQHEGRLTPILTSLMGSLVLPLLYAYFSLWLIIPLWIAIPIFLLVAARVFMIILGREKYRLEVFRRQLYDEYTSSADLVNIKTKHEDGCVEYTNGTVMYLVVAYNGTSEDDLQLSIRRRKLLDKMLAGYNFDVYVHNVTKTPALTEYYDKLHVFSKNTAAKNFIDIIDYSKKLADDKSMVMCTIFAIYGTRSDWKDMRTQIDAAIANKDADCYKTLYRVSDSYEIDSIINENIDSTIVLNDLLRIKYKSNDYGTSKIMKYDIPEDEVVTLGKTQATVEDTPQETFHIRYEEET